MVSDVPVFKAKVDGLLLLWNKISLQHRYLFSSYHFIHKKPTKQQQKTKTTPSHENQLQQTNKTSQRSWEDLWQPTHTFQKTVLSHVVWASEFPGLQIWHWLLMLSLQPHQACDIRQDLICGMKYIGTVL